MRLLLVWLINAAALMALPYLLSSITVDSIPTALIAALLLGLVNTFIRPILILLTIPATLLTLGLFIFVINALTFWLVGSFVQGFHVARHSRHEPSHRRAVVEDDRQPLHVLEQLLAQVAHHPLAEQRGEHRLAV